MRKRDELANPNSCLNKAKDDEMTFVLLGRDLAFAAGVRAWAEERVRLGLNQRDDPKIVEAEQSIATVLAEQSALLFGEGERERSRPEPTKPAG